MAENASVLSDETIYKLKQSMQRLSNEIDKWQEPLESVSSILASPIAYAFFSGSQFGAKAKAKLTTIEDILKQEGQEYKRVIEETDAYLDKQQALNNA